MYVDRFLRDNAIFIEYLLHCGIYFDFVTSINREKIDQEAIGWSTVNWSDEFIGGASSLRRLSEQARSRGIVASLGPRGSLQSMSTGKKKREEERECTGSVRVGDGGREATRFPFWFLVDASGVSISEHSLSRVPFSLSPPAWSDARSCSTHRGRSVADSRNRFASLSVLAAAYPFLDPAFLRPMNPPNTSCPRELIALTLHESLVSARFQPKSVGHRARSK